MYRDFDECLNIINSCTPIQTHGYQNTDLAKVFARFFLNNPNTDLRTIYDMIEQLLQQLQLPSSSHPEDRIQESAQPEAILTGNLVSDLLRVWVRNVRLATFYSEEPPFKSYDAALDWMLSQSMPTTREEASYTDDPVFTHAVTTEQDVGDGKEHRSIRSEYRRPIEEATQLRNVLFEVEHVEKESGLDRMNLVMYVLAGIGFLMPPYRWEVTWESRRIGPLDYMQPELTIHITRGTGWDEWLHLYEVMKRYFKQGKAKGLTMRHLELYHLVHKLGGPPEKKGVVHFWERVRSEWNTRHSGGHSDWRATHKAYRSIVAKVRRGLAESG
jgi:hypothetical protein